MMTTAGLMTALLMALVAPSFQFKCPGSGPNTTHTYGMTWTLHDCNVQPPPPSIKIGCFGVPRIVGANGGLNGACNPYEGDTNCCNSRQILCFKPTGIVPPPGVENATDYYQGWASGIVSATTKLYKGWQLTSEATASAFCAQQLGTGFRIAEHHDGLDGQGGWNFQAIQGINLVYRARFWTFVRGASGNCWDSPNLLP